jgi:hypothetical protein
MWGGTAGDIEVIWVSGEGEYFWQWGWTGQIRLIRFNKFRHPRKQRSPSGRLVEGVTRLFVVAERRITLTPIRPTDRTVRITRSHSLLFSGIGFGYPDEFFPAYKGLS